MRSMFSNILSMYYIDSAIWRMEIKLRLLWDWFADGGLRNCIAG